jgi:hypothetical protein
MHAYIIQQLIRIILFITISLPIGLKSFAQETKRFYMELDTPRNGAKAGQELELKYISTADFDSVSPPDFGTLIETVEGATPHKAGHTVKNGILTNIYEQGFSYRIRFKKPGNTKLPLASIKANGKEYEESSSGDGQYDAFVRALRKIYKVTLGRKFPMLTNYAVSIPPGGRTDAFVQTVITWNYDEQVFRTRGLDADQTEAAIKATMKMLNLLEE